MNIDTKFAIGQTCYYIYDKLNDKITIMLGRIKEILITEEANCIKYYFDNCFDYILEDDIYDLDNFDKIRYKLIKKEIEEGLEE